MKKIAIVTVAVLALGLAACNKSTENVANETAVENNAETDLNAAIENAGVEANADAALNADVNLTDVNAAANATTNAL